MEKLTEKREDVGERSEVTPSSLDGRFSTHGKLEDADKSLSQNFLNQLRRVEEAQIAISKGESEDCIGLLKAMDQLEQSRSFFKSHKTCVETESALLRVNDLIADATKLAEIQFKTKLTTLSQPVDPACLFDEAEVETEQKIVLCKVPTLLRMEDICMLQNLVAKLVRGGHQTQCLNIYRDARKNSIQDSLNLLGVESSESDNTVTGIGEWIKLMCISVKALFAGERNLCNEVLQGLDESTLDHCFVEVISGSLDRLLTVGMKAVAKMEESPNKLFVALNTYEMMCRLEPEMDGMFSSNAGAIMVLPQMKRLIKYLGLVTTTILLDFEKVVVEDASELMANEDVHPITNDVMRYLKYFLDHQYTLMELFVKYGPLGQDEGSQFATFLLQILEALQSNVKKISKYWLDQDRFYLFMMNNTQYMITSVQENEEGKELLGEWIGKQKERIKENENEYIKACWKKVVDTISTKSLLSSIEGSNNLFVTATKLVVTRRLKRFNEKFEQQYQKLCRCKVHDSELRVRLRRSAAKTVETAYSSFLELCRPILKKSRRKCIKYTPEEIHQMLLEKLFAS